MLHCIWLSVGLLLKGALTYYLGAKKCRRKTPKIMKQFIYSGLCYCTKTKHCLLVLRMARMEMDCICKQICLLFFKSS